MHVALRHAHYNHPYHRPDGHDVMQHAQACRDGGERDAHGHGICHTAAVRLHFHLERQVDRPHARYGVHERAVDGISVQAVEESENNR